MQGWKQSASSCNLSLRLIEGELDEAVRVQARCALRMRGPV